MTEQADAWFCRRNEGDGKLGAVPVLPTRPHESTGAGARLLDIDGDGRLELVGHVTGSTGATPRGPSGPGLHEDLVPHRGVARVPRGGRILRDEFDQAQLWALLLSKLARCMLSDRPSIPR